jgi:hypothetical protein
LKYDEIVTEYPSEKLTVGKLKGLLDSLNIDDDALVDSVRLKGSSNSIYLSKNEDGELVVCD